jgi:ribonuclease Y
MMVEKQEKDLRNEKQQVFLLKQELKKIRQAEELTHVEAIEKLSQISGLSKDVAKVEILKSVRESLKREINIEIDYAQKELQQRLEEISQHKILSSMERLAEKVTNDNTAISIKIPNEAFKGKIIGKNGRNKKSFEDVTGTTLQIDQEDTVKVSSFNPIRREIGSRLLKYLIEDGRVQPPRIEVVYNQIKLEFENEVSKIGKEAMDLMGIYDLPADLNYYVGRLKFRYSYGQNVLQHSIEAGRMAEMLAVDLNIDSNKAKRCAFLHDIGKSTDFESSNDHIKDGIKLAERFNLSTEIKDSIAYHHESGIVRSKYVFLTKIADTVSASRPGARADSFEDYIKRMEEIEKICNSFPGVKESYAVQSGREIRILIDPLVVSDKEVDRIGLEVKDKIRKIMDIGGKITITLIREYRHQEILE